MEFFFWGLKNKFETALVNEPSVFEPLKFYCIMLIHDTLLEIWGKITEPGEVHQHRYGSLFSTGLVILVFPKWKSMSYIIILPLAVTKKLSAVNLEIKVNIMVTAFICPSPDVTVH